MTASADVPHIGLVVEGRGDAGALPLLLRKWINSRGDYRDLLGRPVVCDGRDRAIVPDGIEKYVAVAAARPGCQAVLVVLDAEGDPACELGPVLLTRAGKNTWQPRLTNRVDINTATQRSKSLKRMLERFDALLAHMPPG